MAAPPLIIDLLDSPTMSPIVSPTVSQQPSPAISPPVNQVAIFRTAVLKNGHWTRYSIALDKRKALAYIDEDDEESIVASMHYVTYFIAEPSPTEQVIEEWRVMLFQHAENHRWYTYVGTKIRSFEASSPIREFGVAYAGGMFGPYALAADGTYYLPEEEHIIRRPLGAPRLIDPIEYFHESFKVLQRDVCVPSQLPSQTSTPSQLPSQTSTPSQLPSPTSTPSQLPSTPLQLWRRDARTKWLSLAWPEELTYTGEPYITYRSCEWLVGAVDPIPIAYDVLRRAVYSSLRRAGVEKLRILDIIQPLRQKGADYLNPKIRIAFHFSDGRGRMEARVQYTTSGAPREVLLTALPDDIAMTGSVPRR